MSPVRSISLPSDTTRAKLRRRILPFVFLLYITSYLDRANVAFAKMPMSADLGFSEAVYGFGAGIFFLGYLLFGIPGAMLIERSSARKWIARMLIVWGCCTVLVGFVRTPGEFYAARFALGCAEAGFFPGIIIYFSHWFALKDRARAMAGFIMAIPVSLMFGAPFSALILRIDWLGLPGWRWVFILQGLAPVVLGVITFFHLTDYPRDAKWLDPEEREQITAELEEENRLKVKHERVSLWQVLRYKNVLLLALALCAANIGSYAFVLWLPTIIRNSSNLSVSLSTACSALPFVAGLIAVRLAGRSSDRSGERRLHAAIPMIVTGIFFTLSSIPGQPFPLVLLWLCLTGAAAYSWPPPFWVLPTATLATSAAAVSVGLINAIGNLGGFVGPTVVGYLLSLNYSYTVAIAFLSACFVLAGLMILTLRVRPQAGALILVFSLLVHNQARAEDAPRITKQTVLVPMRDGVRLAGDVYLPEPAKKRPVLLMRTPYSKAPIEPVARRYAQAGCSVVVQDCPGRFASEGVFFPYNNEGQDGFDTLEWITATPWSDGRTGMWGASYVGAVQWQAAAEKAPRISVLAPTATWSSLYRNVYMGGAVRLALIAQAAASTMPPPPGIKPVSNWAETLLHLPLTTMEQAIGWPLPWLTGILAHPSPDGYWKRLDITKDIEGLDLPAQHIVGYYDFFSREEVGNFQRMKSGRSQQLILGPWDHGTIGKSKVGDVDFGTEAQIDLAGEGLALVRTGQADEGRAEFTEALSLDPNYTDARMQIGNLLAAKGELVAAANVYREVIRRNPNFAEAHNNLGLALLEGSDFAGAETAFRQALKLQPGYAPALQNLGLTQPCRVSEPRAALTIPRVEGAPELTADPKSRMWNRAATASIVKDCSRSLDYPELRSTVRAFWTDSDLYLLFICPYKKLNIFTPPQNDRARDKLWDRDVVEMFLGDDWTNIRHYREFEIAPTGDWIDLAIDLDRKSYDKD